MLLLKAICDGYSFPANLDRDPPPADSHWPETQLDSVTNRLIENWSRERLAEVLDELDWKHRA